MQDLLEVAAEPNRRRLLQLLGSGECTVSQLAEHFTVSRSAISQHLLLLCEVGLLDARKQGRSRYYSLNTTGVLRLKALLDSFWNNELDLLVAEAKQLAAELPAPSATPRDGESS
ncbi:transcriptional regulator [Arthrobacter sp. MYb211]|uniref:ArsR/SmtB family transcription factor n=1 Tax=Micrococcaceae TaxID=1268 RepID=UPI000CFB4AFF|nr:MULTISPECIES: metalloregulator ArsR/SmtB family transcription factor [unclassified Arthrobacter]PRA00393.1 transcriptional regulator [Arthrobacter sp. MYb224]PRA04585.1 transcriptional regulator [Arthrobacter sp. MYb229]PRA12325.1 transcriptional regulator [Arthrobacter sp. MYb221]PRB51503.1 transcriptional regulator [Arthrobacter sp. MYb216]PRC08788.1 transcriptional regulator [Arthrobacter sp. MYb211]